MSLLWKAIAYFLYSEILFILALAFIPIDPRLWKKWVFDSRILSFIKSYSKSYFTMILIGLGCLFAESIRKMMKYQSALDPAKPHAHHNAHINEVVEEFRAQRNFYITGFALFSWLVIQQLIQNISDRAKSIDTLTLKEEQIKDLKNNLTLSNNEIQILKSKIKSLDDTEKIEKEVKTSTHNSDTEILEDNDSEEDS